MYSSLRKDVLRLWAVRLIAPERADIPCLSDAFADLELVASSAEPVGTINGLSPECHQC